MDITDDKIPTFSLEVGRRGHRVLAVDASPTAVALSVVRMESTL
jgi:hypothetical protein